MPARSATADLVAGAGHRDRGGLRRAAAKGPAICRGPPRFRCCWGAPDHRIVHLALRRRQRDRHPRLGRHRAAPAGALGAAGSAACVLPTARRRLSVPLVAASYRCCSVVQPGHPSRHGRHPRPHARATSSTWPSRNCSWAAYSIATVGALLLSGDRLVLLGVLVAVGAVVRVALWRTEFISTWAPSRRWCPAVQVGWIRWPGLRRAEGRRAAERRPGPRAPGWGRPVHRTRDGRSARCVSICRQDRGRDRLSQGIGLAVATGLAGAGARAVLTGRALNRLETAAGDCCAGTVPDADRPHASPATWPRTRGAELYEAVGRCGHPDQQPRHLRCQAGHGDHRRGVAAPTSRPTS